MTKPLAERVVGLKPSATVEMTERVRAARAAGRKIIGLSSGDPNLDTDPRIIAAAERAMRDGDTHYGPPAGLPALREAIVRRDAVRSGVSYDPADVIVTPGGKFALATALMGTVQPGDEVLVPEPGWVSYGPCVHLCGGTPVGISMLDRIDDVRARTCRDAAHPGDHRQFAGQPDRPRALGRGDRVGAGVRERDTISGSCSTRSTPTCFTRGIFPIRSACPAARSACS